MKEIPLLHEHIRISVTALAAELLPAAYVHLFKPSSMRCATQRSATDLSSRQPDLKIGGRD